MAARKPVGNITRGTTNPNRLRRIDRFLVTLPNLKNKLNPIVVDLGFGASPITAQELLARCTKVNATTTVLGVEIDRERVSQAMPFSTEKLLFIQGGFETPLPSQITATSVDVIRAFNVLRQYQETDVAAAWQLMQSRLTSDGFLIEGTCDELGRYASWVTLNREQPIWFTIALSVNHIDTPSKVQERLPKALIHRNVEGEKVFNLLKDLDRAWAQNSSLSAFSNLQRWMAVCEQLKSEGWPVVSNPKRHKLGELTLEWHSVAPK